MNVGRSAQGRPFVAARPHPAMRDPALGSRRGAEGRRVVNGPADRSISPLPTPLEGRARSHEGEVSIMPPTTDGGRATPRRRTAPIPPSARRREGASWPRSSMRERHAAKRWWSAHSARGGQGARPDPRDRGAGRRARDLPHPGGHGVARRRRRPKPHRRPRPRGRRGLDPRTIAAVSAPRATDRSIPSRGDRGPSTRSLRLQRDHCRGGRQTKRTGSRRPSVGTAGRSPRATV